MLTQFDKMENSSLSQTKTSAYFRNEIYRQTVEPVFYLQSLTII